jgi:hypothetical protein
MYVPGLEGEKVTLFTWWSEGTIYIDAFRHESQNSMLICSDGLRFSATPPEVPFLLKV